MGSPKDIGRLLAFNAFKTLQGPSLRTFQDIAERDTAEEPMDYQDLLEHAKTENVTASTVKGRISTLASAGFVERTENSYMDSLFKLRPKGALIFRILSSYNSELPRLRDYDVFSFLLRIRPDRIFNAQEIALGPGLCAQLDAQRYCLSLLRFGILQDAGRRRFRRKAFAFTEKGKEIRSLFLDLSREFEKTAKAEKLDWESFSPFLQSIIGEEFQHIYLLLNQTRSSPTHFSTIGTISAQIGIPKGKLRKAIQKIEQGDLGSLAKASGRDQTLRSTEKGDKFLALIRTMADEF